MIDLDSELTTHVIGLDWNVRYTEWYNQTRAAAEYMSKLGQDYDEDYMKLGVI